MKNKYVFILLIFGIGMFFSSCSRLEKITVSKRHYRGGYYVDLGGRKPDVKKQNKTRNLTNSPAEKPAESTADLNIALKSKNESDEKMVIAVPEFKSTLAEVEKKEQSPKYKNTKFFASKESISNMHQLVKSQEIVNRENALSNEIATRDWSSTSDLPMWLMIVFCIILPPLAVGLKFGIVDKFWISLLLTLLFWIPGVIYALIVVLD